MNYYRSHARSGVQLRRFISSSIGAFHGTVININDVITFYGSSVTELREEMQKSIEAYFAFCREQGREPEEPLTDKALVQVADARFIELDKTETRDAESK